MSAGVVLALLPATALWLGGHVAAASIVLPEGLRAYPNELGVRFLMAILLSYGLFFALAAGTIKTTLRLATALVVIGVFATVGWDSLAPHVEIVASTNAVDVLMRWVIEAPGPFEVFTGSWALIDV
jgi:hypothetical protein